MEMNEGSRTDEATARIERAPPDLEEGGRVERESDVAERGDS